MDFLILIIEKFIKYQTLKFLNLPNYIYFLLNLILKTFIIKLISRYQLNQSFRIYRNISNRLNLHITLLFHPLNKAFSRNTLLFRSIQKPNHSSKISLINLFKIKTPNQKSSIIYITTSFHKPIRTILRIYCT